MQYAKFSRTYMYTILFSLELKSPPDSGVQRLLDARGQRGSWMPSKIFSIPLAKFLTTFFSRSPTFFTFSHQLSNFTRIRSLDAPPSVASCPSNDIFNFFFGHLPTFYKENWPLGCPPGWTPGAVAPSAPPPHATASRTERPVSNSRPKQHPPYQCLYLLRLSAKSAWSSFGLHAFLTTHLI